MTEAFKDKLFNCPGSDIPAVEWEPGSPGQIFGSYTCPICGAVRVGTRVVTGGGLLLFPHSAPKELSPIVLAAKLQAYNERKS